MSKVIPKGWERVKLGETSLLVIDGDRGKNYPKQEHFLSDGDCLFLNAGNVTKKGFVFDSIKFISKERDTLLGKGKLERGDLVITTRGTIGQFAYYDGHIPYSSMRINSGMAIIRNLSQLFHTKFLLFYFLSSFFSREIRRLSFGSAQPQLTIKIINRFNFLLPPLPEQKRIVAVLETWDEAIDALTKKIQLKENVKKGLMQQLLTGKKRLPGFSGEWKTVKLGEVGQIVTGNTPSKLDSENYGDMFYWATAEDFRSKYINTTKLKLSEKGMQKARPLPSEALLVTCIASIGKNAIAKVPLTTNQQINSIIFSKNYLNEFFYYLISFFKNILLNEAGSGAVKILSKTSFETLKFSIPPLPEQTAIAEILTTADDELTELKNKLKLLEAQKKFLLNNLVTGKIRTPENMTV